MAAESFESPHLLFGKPLTRIGPDQERLGGALLGPGEGIGSKFVVSASNLTLGSGRSNTADSVAMVQKAAKISG